MVTIAVENNLKINQVEQGQIINWFMPFTRVEFEARYVRRYLMDRNVSELIAFMKKMLEGPLEFRAFAFAIEMMRADNVSDIQKTAIQSFLNEVTKIRFVNVDLCDQVLLGSLFLPYISQYCPNINAVVLDEFTITSEFFHQLMTLKHLNIFSFRNVDMKFLKGCKKQMMTNLSLIYYVDEEQDINDLKSLLNVIQFQTLRVHHKNKDLQLKTFVTL